ncbi:MAG: toxin-antitoxin system YwqK family antitoxin [Bacteroidales bacterium]|nr:toxin-antitoxin system YwqK family antitoxin [Bacteroidales bacterium]
MRTLFILFFILIVTSLKSQTDTLNQTNAQNEKIGYWIVYFDNTDKVLEEGKYIGGKRDGLWKQYLEDGTLSAEITYKNDEPSGYAKNYYPNGQVAEEGIWEFDKWVGQYKAYYPNGSINYEWSFNENGKRSGQQVYYHENGKKMIEGNWNNGQESGVIKRYNEKGQLILEQTFNEGVENPDLTVTYHPEKETNIKPDLVKPQDTKPKYTQHQLDSIKALEHFNTTGERKLYDTKRRLTQEGYFENGVLIKGKKYYYNENDLLIKTEIYNNGKLYKTINH